MDVLLLAGVLVAQPALNPTETPTDPTTVTDSAQAGPDEGVVEPAEPEASQPEASQSEPTPTDLDTATASEAAPATQDAAVPEPQPEPASATAQAWEAEPSPLEARVEAGVEDVETSRAGAFISISVGAGHCGAWCSYLRAIGGGRFEAGYRWGHLALGGSASIVGGSYDNVASVPEDIYFTVYAKGSTRFTQLGPVVQLFLASEGRFDPYVSAGIGYRRVVDVAEVEGIDGEVKYWESGAGVTVGAGVPVVVSDRVTVGGRFDKSFAIAGKTCATIGGEAPPDRDRCQSWSKQIAELNPVDERFSRLSRPRPWTVSVELRVSF